jgi:RNA polymerase sigma-70 factor (ECF subfamily)
MEEIDRLLRCHHTKDPAVIEAMVQGFRAPIFRLALSILNDPDDAEDAVQETFVAATLKLDSYQVGTNFKAWLYTIAVNACRGILRKYAARRTLARLLSALEAPAASQPGPEAAAMQSETRSELWDLVERLPEKQRLVILLRLAHGLSIAEIAQVLQIPPKTVYTRLYEAVHSLRGQLLRTADLETIKKEFQV